MVVECWWSRRVGLGLGVGGGRGLVARVRERGGSAWCYW